MLIDERTQSQAEYTGLFLEAANGTQFVGTPTMLPHPKPRRDLPAIPCMISQRDLVAVSALQQCPRRTKELVIGDEDRQMPIWLKRYLPGRHDPHGACKPESVLRISR